MNFTETLQNLTGKPLADCTDQELYLALLELVRQKSADRVQPVTGRKLYYISAEFLIGKLLSDRHFPAAASASRASSYSPRLMRLLNSSLPMRNSALI